MPLTRFGENCVRCERADHDGEGYKIGPTGIVVDDRRITLTMVESALAECNRLNCEMSEFSKLLRSLRPQPADALYL